MSLVVAFDGGASGTRAGCYDAEGALLAETQGGATNPIDVGVASCLVALSALVSDVLSGRTETLGTVVAGISGAGKGNLAGEIATGLFRALHPSRVIVTDDLTLLAAANFGAGNGILAIAGTGSSVYAQADDGRTVTKAGRGTALGDPGGAHAIAIGALRVAAVACDGVGPETKLTERLPTAAGLESFDHVSEWLASASKREVALLASVVADVAATGDAVAVETIVAQAQSLAHRVASAHRALALPESCPVLVDGGVFDRCSVFLDGFTRALEERLPDVTVRRPSVRGHAAAAMLVNTDNLPDNVVVLEGASTALPPATEQRLDFGPPLDQLNAIEIAQSMTREDARAVRAVADASNAIGAAIEAAVRVLEAGGRLIYLGAGTSGRLGVLDASEVPPTFGLAPDRVVAIMAGGDRALRDSVEGAEDDTAQAITDLNAMHPPVADSDMVMGITASGTTPYVRAGLDHARSVGAATALVCCNPVEPEAASIVIALNTGAEVLAGSTRLKAGTATKLVLNQFTTGAMALSGYVFDGLMIGVEPSNTKLRKRAVGIIAELSGCTEAEADDRLTQAEGSIPVAVLMDRLSIEADEAAQRLDAAGGRLRAALEKS
jgi:N-acetylmuramic acid 6-phosphate etherase